MFGEKFKLLAASDTPRAPCSQTPAGFYLNNTPTNIHIFI